jgi:hypothetical protein
VKTRLSRIRAAGWFLSGLALVISLSCDTTSRPDPERYVPEPGAAHRAVEQGLESWRESPEIDNTTPKPRSVIFVDQTRKPGQRLREFAILGVAPASDGCRRFQVKLDLEEPNESILVAYYVFGQGPIWVYRAEDFEMMMHMDPMTKADDPPGGAAPEVKESSSAEPKNHHHVAPSDPSREKIPVR